MTEERKPRNRKEQREARKLANEQGMKYTEALRQVREQRASNQ